MSVDRELVEQVLKIVRNAEYLIVRKIATRLHNPSGTRSWAVAKLAGIQQLRQDIMAILADMTTSLTVEAEKAALLAYTDGVHAITGHATAIVPGQTPAATALAQDLATKTTRLAPYVLRTSLDAYRQAASVSLGNLVLGVSTRRETSQDILDRHLGQGLRGFTDKSGRNWRLDSYVEMATRTGLGNAYLQGRIDTLIDDGGDLVYVIPGPTSCPSCDQWIGKILSLSGNPPAGVEVDGTLAHARSSGHLFGPNCRCVLAKYQPGTSTLPAGHADSSQYEAEQQQRALERDIREAKRREAIALDGVAARDRGRKVLEKQAQLRAHLEAHPQLRRQRHREQIGKAH